MFAYKLDIENGNFVFSDNRLHKNFTSARQDIYFLWNIAIRAIIFATNFIYCCCFQFYNNVICVAYLFKQIRCDSFLYLALYFMLNSYLLLVCIWIDIDENKTIEEYSIYFRIALYLSTCPCLDVIYRTFWEYKNDMWVI